MFHDTAVLPSKSIYDPPNARSVIFKPAHYALKSPPSWGYLNTWPDWTKKVQSSIWTIFSVGIVVLQCIRKYLP